jgi:hypothetical protein
MPVLSRFPRIWRRFWNISFVQQPTAIGSIFYTFYRSHGFFALKMRWFGVQSPSILALAFAFVQPFVCYKPAGVSSLHQFAHQLLPVVARVYSLFAIDLRAASGKVEIQSSSTHWIFHWEFARKFPNSGCWSMKVPQHRFCRVHKQPDRMRLKLIPLIQIGYGLNPPWSRVHPKCLRYRFIFPSNSIGYDTATDCRSDRLSEAIIGQWQNQLTDYDLTNRVAKKVDVADVIQIDR